MSKPLIFTKGQEFGYWTVMTGERISKNSKSCYWVECLCGAKKLVSAQVLKRGDSLSCGCKQYELMSAHFRTHAEGKTALYIVWCHVKARCLNPRDPAYEYYGGRGITVCDEWKDDYIAFRDWALTHGYQKGLFLDRYPDNDGPYSPENCRFTTRELNARNKRNTIFLVIFKERKSLPDWAEDPRCIVSQDILRQRIDRDGWTYERALTTPLRPLKTRPRTK